MKPAASPRIPELSIAPATWIHVIKAVLLGVPAAYLWLFSWELAFPEQDSSEPGLRIGLLAAFSLLAAFASLALSRNLVALARRPALRIGAEGFEIRAWQGMGIIGALLPWYRMPRIAVPWEEFQGALVQRSEVNGITVAAELRISTRDGGLIRFGRDVFSPPLRRIQRSLLDTVDERFRAPLRDQGRLAEFQRLRWAEPLQLPGRNLPAWLIAGLWVMSAVCIALAVHDGFSREWIPFVGVACAIGAGVLHRAWFRIRASLHLEFRPEGLAIGPEPGQSRILPWERLRFARIHTTGDDPKGNAAASIELIELRMDDGEAHFIEGRSQEEFSRIASLLEPPLVLLPLAWEEMSRGLTAELAAVKAGLPPRA